MRKRLAHVKKANGILSNRAFASACGVHDRRVTDWLTSRLPSADNLRQIGQSFGVSIDWLLGFDDVPMRRGERALAGALSDELAKLATARRPDDAFAPELADVAPNDFANAVIDEWWRSLLHRRASDAARKFRQLAVEIQREAVRLKSDPVATVEAHYAVSSCLYEAGRLESPLVDWDAVEGFRVPFFAVQVERQPGQKQSLETDFQVAGGRAFLWRTDRDVAIYIEPAEEWGSLGDVIVRRGTKRSPFFLREAVLFPEEPRRP